MLLFFQEGSDHEEGEDADAEEEESDVGDETSEDSDSEELEEKGTASCTASDIVWYNKVGI